MICQLKLAEQIFISKLCNNFIFAMFWLLLQDQNIDKQAYQKTALCKKNPHTGDTNSLDGCG